MTMRRIFQPGAAIPAAPDDLLAVMRTQARDGHNRGGQLQEPVGIYPEALLAVLARLDAVEGRAPSNDNGINAVDMPAEIFSDARLSARELRVLILVYALHQLNVGQLPKGQIAPLDEIAGAISSLAAKGYFVLPGPSQGQPHD